VKRSRDVEIEDYENLEANLAAATVALLETVLQETDPQGNLDPASEKNSPLVIDRMSGTGAGYSRKAVFS
jgi:predicted Ser/Thr protein kinase